MGWVKKVEPNPHGGPYKNCSVPNSNDRKNFEIGSIWKCDICGNQWEFTGIHDDQWDGVSDKWRKLDGKPADAPTLEPWHVIGCSYSVHSRQHS